MNDEDWGKNVEEWNYGKRLSFTSRKRGAKVFQLKKFKGDFDGKKREKFNIPAMRNRRLQKKR